MTIKVSKNDEENIDTFKITNIDENDLYYFALALQYLIKNFDMVNMPMEDLSKVSLNCNEILKIIPDLQKEEEVQEMDARPPGARKWVQGKGWTK